MVRYADAFPLPWSQVATKEDWKLIRPAAVVGTGRNYSPKYQWVDKLLHHFVKEIS